MISKDKDVRRTKYKRLTSVGFNSYEANRYKDLSASKMEQIIEHKKGLQDNIDRVIKGKKPHDKE